MARQTYKEWWAELKADPVRYALYLEQRRQHYVKRREREHERSKRKYRANKEYYKQKHAEWWAAHPEKGKEYAAKKLAEHGERERERGRRSYERNKEVFLQRDKEYREGPNREKWLKAMLRSRHREYLSAEQLDQLWEQSRNGPCEICGLTGEVMHLDHDHATKSFRGILCDRCNRGIGFFKESIEALKKAIVYLETH